ncbi:MAG TPA: GNAT family N-acetyltransferase [Candidatus Sulfotelmatobacter sp.]|nr:GNAT family N-acetyltransferase [Candidatus Sulfotelmatobacter sp.]
MEERRARRIRRAFSFDAAALARLRAASLRELGRLDDAHAGDFARDAQSDFTRLMLDDRLVAFVLCDGEEIVGSACAIFFERLPYPDGTLHAEIAGVYVAPGHRGEGWAAQLVHAVVDAVTVRGVRKTILHPSPLARPLYERLGFIDEPAMRLCTS